VSGEVQAQPVNSTASADHFTLCRFWWGQVTTGNPWETLTSGNISQGKMNCRKTSSHLDGAAVSGRHRDFSAHRHLLPLLPATLCALTNVRITVLQIHCSQHPEVSELILAFRNRLSKWIKTTQ